MSSTDSSMEDSNEEEYEEEEMSLEMAIKVMRHFESTRLPYGKPKTETYVYFGDFTLTSLR